VTGTAGKPTDLDLIRDRYLAVDVDPRPPVDALVDAALTADLVVVGSRGLHGWRALGSVSERVAHRASSSVLVVRAAAAA
jgi:nucleotide-binding universal stress UspA family protein